MAARDPIEEVLYRTAEIARNGPYGWMRRQSTRLLVQTSAGRLTAVIAHDNDLRSRVRKYMVKNQQWALEALVFGFDIEQFKQEVAEGNATSRAVAAGLVHESPDVAHLAAELVETGEIVSEAATGDGAPESPPPNLPVEVTPNSQVERLEIEQLEARIEELPSEVDAIQKERESATAQVEHLHAEVERLENEVKTAQEEANSLQDEVENLRESMPSKRQQKKQRSELRRAQRFLEEREELQARAKRAEQERVEAVQEIAAIRAEAEEMELALREKVRRHKRARTALEQSLATAAGRAEYLARSMESELADAEKQPHEGSPATWVVILGSEVMSHWQSPRTTFWSRQQVAVGVHYFRHVRVRSTLASPESPRRPTDPFRPQPLRREPRPVRGPARVPNRAAVPRRRILVAVLDSQLEVSPTRVVTQLPFLCLCSFQATELLFHRVRRRSRFLGL